MSGLVRCFIAVEIPQHILNHITEYTSELKPLAPNIRWVRLGAMHITLKFLGEISESLVERVRDKLMPIRLKFHTFELAVKGSGFFPSQRSPRVIWIGLEQDNNRSLFKVQQWIEDALLIEGFNREKRRFSPHITLGRIKLAGHLEPVFNYLERNPFPTQSFSANAVNLMRSRLKPDGAEYSVIESYPFTG
jgi:2'-5' RNA ligase